MSDSLSEIRAAIYSFDMEQARGLLRDALKDPSAETYYLASLASLTENQRLNFLKQAVELDPFHKEATDALAKLERGQPEIEMVSVKEVKPPKNTATPPVQKTSNAPASSERIDNRNIMVVTGAISGEAKISLYHIPDKAGNVRTQMPQGAEVIVLTRDEQVKWFNIVFTASTGQQLLGWVETDNVNNIGIQGNPIEILDLPVTQFEWNDRDDVDALIKAKAQPTSNIIGIIALFAIGAFSCFFSIPFISSRFSGDQTVGFVLVLIGGGLVVWGVTVVNKRQDMQKSPHMTEIKRLKKIKQAMKPESQKLMETQLISTAINTAVNVGSTIITKMIPEKKDITVRNK